MNIYTAPFSGGGGNPSNLADTGAGGSYGP